MAAKIRPERYTILHKLNLNLEACEKTAKATGIISYALGAQLTRIGCPQDPVRQQSNLLRELLLWAE